VGVEAIVEAVILHCLLTLLVLAPVCAHLISTSDDILTSCENPDSLFCRRHIFMQLLDLHFITHAYQLLIATSIISPSLSSIDFIEEVLGPCLESNRWDRK